MNIFDWLHEEFFDLLFGLDKADRQESACFARERWPNDRRSSRPNHR